MPQDAETFLTLSQAVDALASDFEQYGSQQPLFHRIAPLILGKDFKTENFDGLTRAWVRRKDGCSFETVEDSALGYYLIHMLETGNAGAKDMARICGLAFETSVRPGKYRGESGIWVEGQMAGFVCKRCGGCCSRLGNTCTQEDVRSWQDLGRGDILAWIRQEHLDKGKIQYRAWVDPQTGKTTESCPFLAEQSGTEIFFCTIQDVKPLVCREFPFTRKHARYTGCPGFDFPEG